jgi:HKD family nuclease
MTRALAIAVSFLFVWCGGGCYSVLQRMPRGTSYAGAVRPAAQVSFLADLLETEKAVIALSDGEIPSLSIDPAPGSGPLAVQVLTEGKIRTALLQELERATDGDHIDVAVFYLSSSGVIESLLSAHRRGARLRILLDPNKDAFGYEKNGIPNRPVAALLQRAGVPVRWCDTHGEQCHAKMLLARRSDGEALLVVGSANFTRRNLQDYNLETSVAVRGPQTSETMRDAAAYFNLVWSNDEGRVFSTPYETYGSDSPTKKLLYELEESTGLGTF